MRHAVDASEHEPQYLVESDKTGEQAAHKPEALKRHTIELYCLGLSMNAVAKRVGVSAQSMLRWVRDHARQHCPKPEPTGSTAVVELDEVWHFVEKNGDYLVDKAPPGT